MLQIEWEKTLKSKQRNTAIFGAKNIDLLEFCTTNNNHFGGKTAERIGTKDTNNNDDDDDKKMGNEAAVPQSNDTHARRRKRGKSSQHQPAPTTDKNQIHCENLFQWMWLFFRFVSIRFFSAFSFQIIYAIRMDIDFDGRKYFCHNVGNFYLARHAAMNRSNQLVLNAKLVFGTIEYHDNRF